MMEGGEAPSEMAPPLVAVVHVGTHDLQGSDEVPGNQTEINAVSTDIINECVSQRNCQQGSTEQSGVDSWVSIVAFWVDETKHLLWVPAILFSGLASCRVTVLCSVWYLLNFLRQTRPRMETLVVGLLPRGPEDGTDSALRTVCAPNVSSGPQVAVAWSRRQHRAWSILFEHIGCTSG